MSTTERALTLLGLLQSRRVWTGEELAERLGVTTRTVRRDIERLRGLGYPVAAAQGVAGGYRLATGGALPPLLLDDEQAFAVAVCLRLGAATGVHGVEDAAMRTLTVLDAMLPTRVRERVDAVREATVTLPGLSPEAVDAELLLTLARAIRDGVRLDLDYTARDGADSHRAVEPYRLVSTGRRWYLFAWDRDRADWRTFRLDRITAARAGTLRFARREEPDAAAHLQRALTQAPYRFVGRVRFDVDADALRARVPPGVATVTAIDGDGCLLEAGADDLDWIAWHIARLALDLGAPIRVLDPPALAGAVRRLGQRLLALTR